MTELLIALAIVIFGGGGFLWKRNRNARNAKDADTGKRVIKGQKAANKAEDRMKSGTHPQDIVDENKGKW